VATSLKITEMSHFNENHVLSYNTSREWKMYMPQSVSSHAYANFSTFMKAMLWEKSPVHIT
jgi:hypothetical protein